MRNPRTKAIGGAMTATLFAGALALCGATSASAGVTGCSASGGKQEGGAVIGAVVGGLIGHQVGGRHATGETVAGAALGAAAGSAIGCEAQKNSANNHGRGEATYRRDGYELASAVTPASYRRLDETFAARSRVILRAGPSTRSARLGGLRAGERFQALARVRGTDWILVGQRGVGIGYVRSDFVHPVRRGYAGY